MIGHSAAQAKKAIKSANMVSVSMYRASCCLYSYGPLYSIPLPKVLRKPSAAAYRPARAYFFFDEEPLFEFLPLLVAAIPKSKASCLS